MDRELTPEEITELLPTYALDAVDDDERAAIDAYLDAHPDERDDVADLQITASMLAHTGGPPPDGVWERLESMITTTPPPLRVVPPTVLIPPSTPAPETARPDRRWRWLAAAAAVVALVFGGLWLVERGDGGGGAAGDTASLTATAATAPGARHATLTSDDGSTLATAIVTTDGSGYLTSELPPAPRGTRTSCGASPAPGRSRSACSVAIPAPSRSRPRVRRPVSRSPPKSWAACR